MMPDFSLYRSGLRRNEKPRPADGPGRSQSPFGGSALTLTGVHSGVRLSGSQTKNPGQGGADLTGAKFYVHVHDGMLRRMRNFPHFPGNFPRCSWCRPAPVCESGLFCSTVLNPCAGRYQFRRARGAAPWFRPSLAACTKQINRFHDYSVWWHGCHRQDCFDP
jgi:hypothetical protein